MKYNTIIDKLLREKTRLLTDIATFKRSIFQDIDNAIHEKYNVFPILFGLRRTGKTTIILQLMKKYETSIYITFRNSYISTLSRIEFIELIEEIYYAKYNYIFLDDVQLNPEWSEIIVEIYDSFPKIKMVITGSSTLSLEQKETGLDRTRKFNIQSLSFGEYLNLSKKLKNQTTFENFLGFGGFPKYAQLLANNKLDNFDEQRSEILDDIISNDIPNSHPSTNIYLISRFYMN